MRNRSPFFLISLAVTVLSFLTGMEVLPGPDSAGIILAFFSIFVIPAILINRLFRVELAPRLPCLARLTATGFIYMTLLVSTGFLPGVSLPVISSIGAALNIILVVALLLRNRPGREERMDRFIRSMLERGRRDRNLLRIAAFLLLFALLFTVYYGNGAISPGMDSLDHVSFIRRAAETGDILPEDSFYIEGDGEGLDPRKGLFHSAAALIAVQADADPLILWKVLPALLAFFGVISFMFFAGQLLESQWRTALAVILLFIFFRGEGGSWFTRIAYSRNIAQVLFWLNAGFVIWRLKERELAGAGFLLFLTAIVAAAIHPVFALMTFVFMLALFVHTFLPGADMSRSGVLKIAAINLAGAALPLLIKLPSTGGEYNLIHTHMQGMLRLSESLRIPDPLELQSSRGVILLFSVAVLPLYFTATGIRRKFRKVEMVFLIPILLVIIPFSASFMEKHLGYMFVRILNAAPVICFLAFILPEMTRVAFTGRSSTGPDRGNFRYGLAKRMASASAVAFFIIYPLNSERLDNVTNITERDYTKKYQAVFEEMNRHTGDRSVILSDPVTSYYISALTGHFVYLVPAQHEPPTDLKALERNRRVRDLLCTPLAAGDRTGWLEEEKIRYLLLDNNGKEVTDYYGISDCVTMAGLKYELIRSETFRHISEIGEYSLFRVEGGRGVGMTEGIGMELPVDVPAGAFRPESDAGCGIELHALYLRDSVYEAGSQMSGILYWKAEEVPDFGLPLVCTVRLDTEFPRGNFFREWYGKPYRRRLEAEKGERYRFTFSGMVRGEYGYPDRWKKGRIIEQDFLVTLPVDMKGGKYRFRVQVWKKSYLRNRVLADYFMNDDSRQGKVVADILIEESGK